MTDLITYLFVEAVELFTACDDAVARSSGGCLLLLRMRAHCLGDVITYGMTQPVTSRRWDDRRSDAARSDPCFIMATVAGGRRDTRGVLWDTPPGGQPGLAAALTAL